MRQRRWCRCYRALHILLGAICPEYRTHRSSACATVTTDPDGGLRRRTTAPDLERTLDVMDGRVARAVALAAGVEVEADAPRAVLPAGGAALPVVVRLHNRGSLTLAASGAMVKAGPGGPPAAITRTRILKPGTTVVDTVLVTADSITQPWWLTEPRRGDLFALPGTTAEDALRTGGAAVSFAYQIEEDSTGATFGTSAPIVCRFADPVLGQVTMPVAVAPAVSVTLDQYVALVPANAEMRRDLAVRLRSADTAAREVTVQAEAAARAGGRQRDAHGAARPAARPGDLTFHLRGRLAPRHRHGARGGQSGGADVRQRLRARSITRTSGRAASITMRRWRCAPWTSSCRRGSPSPTSPASATTSRRRCASSAFRSR